MVREKKEVDSNRYQVSLSSIVEGKGYFELEYKKRENRQKEKFG